MIRLRENKPCYQHLIALKSEEEELLREVMRITGKGVKPTVLAALKEFTEKRQEVKEAPKVEEKGRDIWDRLSDLFRRRQ